VGEEGGGGGRILFTLLLKMLTFKIMLLEKAFNKNWFILPMSDSEI